MRLTYFPSSAGRSKQYEQTQLMSGTAEVVVEEEEERRRSRAAKTPSSSSEVATIGGKSKADKFHSEPNSLPTSLSYIYTLSLFTRERMLIVVLRTEVSLERVIITITMLLFLRSRDPETGSPPPAYVLALLLERTTVFSADYPAARKVITHPFKRLMWLCLFVSALRSATDDEDGGV